MAYFSKNPKLTQEILLTEYVNWAEKFKNGRNDSDLRFGQYIHNTYDLYYSGNILEHPNGFYTEDIDEAYSQIFKCQF